MDATAIACGPKFPHSWLCLEIPSLAFSRKPSIICIEVSRWRRLSAVAAGLHSVALAGRLAREIGYHHAGLQDFQARRPQGDRRAARLDGSARHWPRASAEEGRPPDRRRRFGAAQPQPGHRRLERRVLRRQQGGRAAGRGFLRRRGRAGAAARDRVGGFGRRAVRHLQAARGRHLARRQAVHLGRRRLFGAARSGSRCRISAASSSRISRRSRRRTTTPRSSDSPSRRRSSSSATRCRR